MVIRFYADSLGLPRPGLVLMKHRYINIFQEWLREKYGKDIFIVDRSEGGSTIGSLYKVYNKDEEYFQEENDIMILQVGIVDCFPRPTNLFIRNSINALPGFLRWRIIELIKKKRASILQAGYRFYLTDRVVYEVILKDWLSTAVTKFQSIYIFNIAPTTDELEKHSPGAKESIDAYNAVIKKVVSELGSPNIHLLDIYTLLQHSGHGLHQLIADDGHHITPLAHELYAQQLISQQQTN